MNFSNTCIFIQISSKEIKQSLKMSLVMRGPLLIITLIPFAPLLQTSPFEPALLTCVVYPVLYTNLSFTIIFCICYIKKNCFVFGLFLGYFLSKKVILTFNPMLFISPLPAGFLKPWIGFCMHADDIYRAEIWKQISAKPLW